jgi:peptidoglycan hydrolase-like amidase
MNRQTRSCFMGAALTVVLAGILVSAQPELPLFSAGNSLSSGLRSQINDYSLIRVGLSDDSMLHQEYPGISLTATTSFVIEAPDMHQMVLQGVAGLPIVFSRNNKGLWVKPAGLSNPLGPFNGALVMRSLSAQGRIQGLSFTRKGKQPLYKGTIQILPSASKPDLLLAVNILPMQEYLKAVVPNELPASFGLEAIKAQAIAARNYALRPREKNWTQFDICDSQYCQAYYGAQTEDALTSKALLETTGLVALSNGEPILALYSSTNGGVTEAFQNVFSEATQFPGSPKASLTGGGDWITPPTLSDEVAARKFWTSKPHSFDILSPLYRWQKVWTEAELSQTLEKTLPMALADSVLKPNVALTCQPKAMGFGVVQDIRVTQRSPFGKIMRLDIQSNQCTAQLSKEYTIRKILTHGGKMLPSANAVFDIQRNSTGLVEKITTFGGGFGHGVGMSQYGASYLDKQQKWPFYKILQHYYKGTSIGTPPLMVQAGVGAKTQFYAPFKTAMLWFKAQDTRPVVFHFNERAFRFSPSVMGTHRIPIESWIRPKQLNNFWVEPREAGSLPLTTWVEVVSASALIRP